MVLCDHYQPCECERSWLAEQIIRDNNRFREMRQRAITEREELGMWPQDVSSDDDERIDKSGCSCIAFCACRKFVGERRVNVLVPRRKRRRQWH